MKYLILLSLLTLAACAVVGRDGSINITLDRKIEVKSDIETDIKTNVETDVPLNKDAPNKEKLK